MPCFDLIKQGSKGKAPSHSHLYGALGETRETPIYKNVTPTLSELGTLLDPFKSYLAFSPLGAHTPQQLRASSN